MIKDLRPVGEREMPKKYIPMKDRPRLFKKKKKKLHKKLETDKSLTEEERKKLRKRLSRMGKGSVSSVSGGSTGLVQQKVKKW